MREIRKPENETEAKKYIYSKLAKYLCKASGDLRYHGFFKKSDSGDAKMMIHEAANKVINELSAQAGDFDPIEPGDRGV